MYDALVSFWADPYSRGLVIAFIVFILIAIVKKFSEYFNESTLVKRIAVVFLSIASVVLAQLQMTGTLNMEELSKAVATAILGSFGLYETVGKATKSVLYGKSE